MDTLWSFVGLIIWALETIWEHGKHILIGGAIGFTILYILSAISTASTERHRKEEELQRGVDHLESEITEIKRELDQITNRLGDIEEAVRPVEIDTDPI